MVHGTKVCKCFCGISERSVQEVLFGNQKKTDTHTHTLSRVMMCLSKQNVLNFIIYYLGGGWGIKKKPTIFPIPPHAECTWKKVFIFYCSCSWIQNKQQKKGQCGYLFLLFCIAEQKNNQKKKPRYLFVKHLVSAKPRFFFLCFFFKTPVLVPSSPKIYFFLMERENFFSSMHRHTNKSAVLNSLHNLSTLFLFIYILPWYGNIYIIKHKQNKSGIGSIPAKANFDFPNQQRTSG